MKNLKKFIIFLAILALCACLYFIISTYAKYLTSANATSNIPISKWNILVNNQSIKDNPNISAVLSPVFPGNSNIAANIVAPTAEGYFDLAFDYTNTDVSFSYTITTTVNATSSVQDIVSTGYSTDGGNTITNFTNPNDPISATVLYNDTTRTKNYRIYIEWIDDGTATMDNAADTNATIGTNPTALFDVNISFIQQAT